MHDDLILDDIIEEDKEKYPPDRQQFQNDLETINAEMKIIRNKIRNLCLKCTTINDKIRERRREKDDLRQQSRKSKEDYGRIKSSIDSKKKTTLDLEKDCRIRNKEALEKLLVKLENRYKNKELALRDEQALVTEIDTMKRNRTKLETLNSVMREKNELEKTLVGIKKSNQDIFTRLLVVQEEIKSQLKERHINEAEIQLLRENLKHFEENRRRLIGNYENNRAEYKSWLSENKKKSGGLIPLSFPSARKASVFIEDEELEPYYEQKLDCRKLIRYLESIKIHCCSESESAKGDSEDDSADELPPQFQKKYSKVASIPTNNPKRNVRKGNQPISHNIEIYNLFGAVEVDVPQVYSDVPDVLKAVQEKLDFYEQQTTNELDWSEEFAGIEFLSISRTVSELGSSICDDSLSDVASVSSYLRASSRSSCQSPLAETPKNAWF